MKNEIAYILNKEDDRISTLANASAIINNHLANVNWVGFYILKNNELVLGPFQGNSACTRISLARGVCGKCAREKSSIIVPNVLEFPGHIACDCNSQSELCIPLIVDDKLYGLLDIDSPLINRFNESDREALEEICKLIEERL